MEHRLRTSQEVIVQIGRTWTLTYDAIQSAVESVNNLELQEEQKTTRGATTRTTARRGVVANALLTEGQATQIMTMLTVLRHRREDDNLMRVERNMRVEGWFAVLKEMNACRQRSLHSSSRSNI